MIIHVDIDGTIIDIYSEFEKAFGITKKNFSYNLDERYYPGALDDMIRLLEDDVDDIVYDGSFETINEMIDAGHVVWITTLRSPLAIRRFQEKYPGHASIVRSKHDIIESGDRCDVLVDDHPLPEHVDLAGKTFIIQRDYNETYMPGLPRIASIIDIVPVITGEQVVL